jgi:uncharacterized protein
VAKSAKSLIIGSVKAYSGKTGIILSIARQLQEKNIAIAYGKPVGTRETTAENDEGDVGAIARVLALSEEQTGKPLLYLNKKNLDRRLGGEDTTNYTQALVNFVGRLEGDLVFLEAAGTLDEGSLFDLSLEQMAEAVDSRVLLVSRYTSSSIPDSFLKAKKDLGDRLLGVIINDIPIEKSEEVQTLVKPFLENLGIAVLGMLPSSRLLRSVSVRELVRQLGATVLCRSDRLDLMVESLTIGAMNVNSALEYFRQGENKAVITGGGRSDLQLAALETSTSCLILTGHTPPQPMILSRAEDLEIPILAVNLDTLTTVEIVDRAFGQVRLQEQIKIECIQELTSQYFDLDRFLTKLGVIHHS